MDFAKVNAEVRQETGKGHARRTRVAGRVPAVLYGRREQPVSLSLDPLALVRSLDKERKRNTVFSLAVADNGKSTEITAMIRDVQIDPLSRRITHVDFLRVSLDEEVRVTVPIQLTGTPAGVIDGGNLHHNIHNLALAAKPGAIPGKIAVDVSKLKIGEALHVSDMTLPEGLRALLDPKSSIASVVAPRAEKVEAEAAATPAEGAAAPAAAGDKKEGAAAAGGDKKGAAAPAKEAEKKK